MGLDFLRHYGGRRTRGDYAQQPLLWQAGDAGEEAVDGARLDHGLEMPPSDWHPLDVLSSTPRPNETPRRFIDGCHAGHTVAWLRNAAGYPVPLMLAEIGGVCLRAEGRNLKREFAQVERVVSFVADAFPWREVEDFAAALAELRQPLRLLPAQKPLNQKIERRELSMDFEVMRKQAQNRSNDEMAVLEELALDRDYSLPSVVDGRLEPRLKRQEMFAAPIIGIIKQQREDYLHHQGWQTFFDLQPGQRTPAFEIKTTETGKELLPVVSWYLKLEGADGSLPNWGVVRVEITREHFEQRKRDFGYLDRLSHSLFQMRSRSQSYSRGPVSLEPIIRAEESLKALFAPAGALTHRFYRLTGL